MKKYIACKKERVVVCNRCNTVVVYNIRGGNMYHEITCTSSYTFLPVRISLFKVNNWSMHARLWKSAQSWPERHQNEVNVAVLVTSFYTFFTHCWISINQVSHIFLKTNLSFDLKCGRFFKNHINFKKITLVEAATRGFVKNFTIFTGKHLCWNLFLIKL